MSTDPAALPGKGRSAQLERLDAAAQHTRRRGTAGETEREREGEEARVWGPLKGEKQY